MGNGNFHGMIEHGDNMSEFSLDHLNPQQREAVTTVNQHVRIVAGAGSGKTRVLMSRIAYLVSEIGVFPSRIMAITFTNKATQEMKDRLYQMIRDDARLVRISTIHSLCVRMLREDGGYLGYPKSFAILDRDDQAQILSVKYKELDVDRKSMPYPRVLSYISGNKTNYVSPSQAMELAFNEEQTIMATLYAHYEEKRIEMKAMDFDDLLLEGKRLLESELDVRTKWQKRLDYIHVDEFQDVDVIQYAIIRLLTGKQTNLCVVGDPDQTIYTWRGASVDIIMRFHHDFKNVKTIILNQNYRSTQPILDASNALIKHNKNRIKKDLFTEIKGQEKIHTIQTKEDAEEPIRVIREIYEDHKKGTDYSDMAILYRSNYSSREFERDLRKSGIPYVIYGGIRFYERQEIKDALSYLRLCCKEDPDDQEAMSLDLAVLRVLNQPRRGIGKKSIEQLQEIGAQKGINLFEVMKDETNMKPALYKKCQPFVELIEHLRRSRDEMALEDFLQYVLEQSGYLDMLTENQEEERKENLMELKQDLVQSREEDPEMTLETYLQDIALFNDRSQENSSDSLSLMTVHAAKGLEFDNVYIVNFNEGVFPSSRAMQEGGKAALEEERRLCYVAMTRAKKKLCLSWNGGYSYVLETYKSPSRFLNEIPREYLEEEEKPKEQKKEREGQWKPNATNPYRNGDLVTHKVYGEGVIVAMDGNVATVAFSHGIGVKKLNALHPSLKKVVS